MNDIFVSYRRSDTGGVVGRIIDRLGSRLGKDFLFRDVDSIRYGDDFRASIRKALHECKVVLIIIGEDWLDVRGDDGGRRLDDPNDYVRIEVATALQQGVFLIPVLLEGASIPNQADLPDDLSELAHRSAAIVREDPDFDTDMRRLCHQLEALVPRIRRRRLLVRLVATSTIVVALGFATEIMARQMFTDDSTDTQPHVETADGWAIWDEVGEADRLVTIAQDHYKANRPLDAENSLSKAIVIYQKAAKLHPNHLRESLGDSYHFLGLVYLGSQRFTEAEEKFNQALPLYRSLAADYAIDELKVALILNRLGNLRRGNEEWKKAELFYREARESLQTFRDSVYFPFEGRSEYVSTLKFVLENLAATFEKLNKTDSAQLIFEDLESLKRGEL